MNRKTISVEESGIDSQQSSDKIPKSGYITDYISNMAVKGTPEELEAVQVFSQRLVEDYDYKKTFIQTRPQFRVRKHPSDEEKSYPVDIAVFRSEKKIEDELFMIVECKKKNRKDGVAQLKLYMDMSPAEVGVWFNGDEHEYLRKIYHKDGSRTYTILPNIPRHGQRIEDIGLFSRKDLKKPSNLKAVFRDIRNHLAGMTTGITRDEALAQEIINILFCKILDEQETDQNKTVTFRAGVGEAPKDVQDRILILFERVKTATYEDVFNENDTISLDAESLCYVVGELQNYCIMDADRDAIGDSFEVFIGPALRGSEGQFFTPRNVIKMMVKILDPKPSEKIIDPACGSGGFLIVALEHVWTRLREQSKRKGWTEKQLFKREVEVATDCFRGIDKDTFLAKVCKAYMALVGDGRGGVFCANSLNRPDDWQFPIREKVKLGSFDIVMTNPPFGNKIVVKGATILSQFDFGYKWKYDKKTDTYQRTTTLFEDQPPQLLFLERCLQLLRDDGRLGIVLPESILGNPSYGHVIYYLLEKVTILAIVTMPESLFKTSGKGGTHTKVCALFVQKKQPSFPYKIFMAEAKWCGHDSRGNPTIKRLPSGENILFDDVPTILERFQHIASGNTSTQDHFGYLLSSEDIKNRILVPKYYNPEIDIFLKQLSKSHDLITIGEYLKNNILSIDTGIEIGKMAYGTGKIPFIRTSDLSNWEIKTDFKHGVSSEIYEEFKDRVDVEPGDILIVRDGTYLIGTTAIVTDSDVPMLFQSHIYRIRVLKPDQINSWLLLACLSSPIVKRQIRAKQFTQDIIDTIGKRFFEVFLPIPKDIGQKKRITEETKHLIETRIQLRNRAKEITFEVEGIGDPNQYGLDEENGFNFV
jgi:type I restriction enzyme M protein